MNNEIAARLAAGDESAYQELILANTGLAMDIVNEFVARSSKAKNLKDDLEGEALLALTTASNQLRTEFDPTKNVTAFLAVVIRRSLSHFLATEDTVSVPQRTQQRARDRGEDITVNCQTLVADVCQKPAYTLDVTDELRACAKSDSEKQVVDLVLAGATAEQIANKTGLALNTVLTYTRRIHNRFTERSLAI